MIILRKTQKKQSGDLPPTVPDLFPPPPTCNRLSVIRKPIWSDMVPTNVVMWWRESRHLWSTDPTIRQPGFSLPRRSWSTLNRFRTGQGPCAANLHKWHLASSAKCQCGEIQTMHHIMEACPLTN